MPVRVACDNEAGCRRITPLASCALREPGPPGRRANNRVRLSAVAEVAVSADNAVGVMRPTGAGPPGRRANNRVRLSAVAEVAVSADNRWRHAPYGRRDHRGVGRIAACGYPPWRKWRYPPYGSRDHRGVGRITACGYPPWRRPGAAPEYVAVLRRAGRRPGGGDRVRRPSRRSARAIATAPPAWPCARPCRPAARVPCAR